MRIQTDLLSGTETGAPCPETRWLARGLTTTALLACALLLGGCTSDPAPGTDTGDVADDSVLDAGDVSDDGGDDVTDTTPDSTDTNVDTRRDVPAECQRNIECDDGNPCSEDLCIENTCDNTRAVLQVADATIGDCQRAACNGTDAIVVVDNTDIPRDDGIGCTIEQCIDGNPDVVASDEVCDDGDDCNGVDFCGATGCETTLVSDDPEGDADLDGIRNCEDSEDCDGLDNDGDGIIDNNLTIDGLGLPCYSGPDGTASVGACIEGVLACTRGLLQCDGEIVPEDDERCDGRDNTCDGTIPVSEEVAGCTTDPTVTRDAQTIQFEVLTEAREVDVHFNMDTTGSMSGIINTLTDTLIDVVVPGIEHAIPDAAYGLSSFRDFPFGGFGSSNDDLYILNQRVTTRVRRVLDAIGLLRAGGGSDGPEAGIDSLYQVCTGSGVAWSASSSTSDNVGCSPFGKLGVVGLLGAQQWYSVHAHEGDVLRVESFSDCADADGTDSADPTIVVLDAATELLTQDEDGGPSRDAVVQVVIQTEGEYRIGVVGDSPFDAGWYLMQVTLDGERQVPNAAVCTSNDVGVNNPIPLFGESFVASTYDYEACVTTCDAVGAPDDWVDSYCLGGFDDRFTELECGNGVIEDGEVCDDGNDVDDDGCTDCAEQLAGVPPFDSQAGYFPSYGHGLNGGVGFRDDAIRVIVHMTDAFSHRAEDYLAYDETLDVHTPIDLARECEKLGVRIVGVASAARIFDEDPLDSYTLPALAIQSNAVVPPCAFDGSAARTSGVCAIGECCTGEGGEGVPPLDDGLCPLRFLVSNSGGGLPDAIVSAIEAMSRFSPFRFIPSLSNHEDNMGDARCLVHGIRVLDHTAPTSCSVEPMFVDGNGDGMQETVIDGTPGSRLLYEFDVSNIDVNDYDEDGDTTESCVEPGIYGLELRVQGTGNVTLGSDMLWLTVTE